MSTTSPGADDTIRPPDCRPVVFLAAYAAGLLATVVAVTLLAVSLVSITHSLGGYLLVAAGWLAIVSASPTIATAGARRLASVELGRRSPGSNTEPLLQLVRRSGSRGSREAYLGTDDEGTP